MKPEKQLLESCKHKLAELRSMARDFEIGKRLPRSRSDDDLLDFAAEYRSLNEEIEPLEAFIRDCETLPDRSIL